MKIQYIQYTYIHTHKSILNIYCSIFLNYERCSSESTPHTSSAANRVPLSLPGYTNHKAIKAFTVRVVVFPLRSAGWTLTQCKTILQWNAKDTFPILLSFQSSNMEILSDCCHYTEYCHYCRQRESVQIQVTEAVIEPQSSRQNNHTMNAFRFEDLHVGFCRFAWA